MRPKMLLFACSAGAQASSCASEVHRQHLLHASAAPQLAHILAGTLEYKTCARCGVIGSLQAMASV